MRGCIKTQFRLRPNRTSAVIAIDFSLRCEELLHSLGDVRYLPSCRYFRKGRPLIAQIKTDKAALYPIVYRYRLCQNHNEVEIAKTAQRNPLILIASQSNLIFPLQSDKTHKKH